MTVNFRGDHRRRMSKISTYFHQRHPIGQHDRSGGVAQIMESKTVIQSDPVKNLLASLLGTTRFKRGPNARGKNKILIVPRTSHEGNVLTLRFLVTLRTSSKFLPTGRMRTPATVFGIVASLGRPLICLVRICLLTWIVPRTKSISRQVKPSNSPKRIPVITAVLNNTANTVSSASAKKAARSLVESTSTFLCFHRVWMTCILTRVETHNSVAYGGRRILPQHSVNIINSWSSNPAIAERYIQGVDVRGFNAPH